MAECLAAYRPDYEKTWDIAPWRWQYGCQHGKDPGAILSDHKAEFFRSCLRDSIFAIQAGLMQGEKVAELCAEGRPGRARIPKPPQQPAQSQKSDLAAAAKEIAAANGQIRKLLVEHGAAALYGEHTPRGTTVPSLSQVTPAPAVAGLPEFHNDKELERWHSPHKDIDAKARYYARMDPYIRHCLENPSIPNERPLDVSTYDRDLCKKSTSFWHGDRKLGNSVRYHVSKSNGSVRLAASLYFTYRGKPENRDASVARLEKVKDCMMDFFAKHGISLKLRFRIDSGLRDWIGSDTAINLWDHFSRSNPMNWAMLEQSSPESMFEDISEMEACSIAIHEFGHTVGLPDTYPDPDCPDRKYIGPFDDIMRHSRLGPEVVRFYPWEIKSILKPLCEK